MTTLSLARPSTTLRRCYAKRESSCRSARIPSCLSSHGDLFEITVEDGKCEDDQLAHDRDNDQLRGLTLGFESISEGLEDRIEPRCDDRRHVEGAVRAGLTTLTSRPASCNAQARPSQ